MTISEADNAKKRFISIRTKLVFAFILVGSIILVTVVSLAYVNARQALETAAFAELELLRETRGNQLLLWFNEWRRDAKALSRNPLVIEAMRDFSGSLQHIPETAQPEYLQTIAQLYRNQPETVSAADDSVYTQIHARFHPFFGEYLETYGYKDLYLVTPNGDIVYSVNKQADFGTNLIQGPFSHGDAAGPISRPHTNISTVFHQVLQVNDPRQTVFQDFENYPASDQPSAFLGSGIFDGDELIGVLILQLPIDIMDTVLNQYAGLGQTGETYVVGSDLLFRNDSRFLEELGTDSTILNKDFVVETRAAVAGRVGISDIDIIENYQGKSVLSGWRPVVMQEPIPNVDDFGIIWVLIAEINTAEALAPANRLLISSLGAGLLVGILILLIAYVFSNRIARPIQRLTDTAKLITQGDLSQRAHINTDDETGVLAQAFNLMTRQLGQFIDTLEQRVTERTAQLEASNRELEAFSYSISHDLRAPLRHIAGFVGLLRQREEERLDLTSLRYLDNIADSAHRMGELVDDLLAFSRTGRAEMRVRQIELDELIREVQQELSPEMKDRYITWEVGPLPPVQADPTLLRQVWVNLLSNAIKFTAPRPKAYIEIGTVQEKSEPSEVTLFVRDNGVGFDPQYTHKLFGVFQRLHGKEEFEGTGIGLATVRRIVERHGGRVWAEGDLDHGATFYVTLRQTRGV